MFLAIFSVCYFAPKKTTTQNIKKNLKQASDLDFNWGCKQFLLETYFLDFQITELKKCIDNEFWKWAASVIVYGKVVNMHG